ncbi:MAG: TadE/TadG family type IV pilus assembly protein [Terriglobales bacterium]
MKASTIRHRQRGLTTVEFSIVGVTLMVVLFGVLELSRLMFDLAVLREGARRAARLAAVCPIGSPNIQTTADFGDLPDFGPGNVLVQYLNAAGFPTFAYANVSYVQVSIVGYAIPLEIPLVNAVVNSPAFITTLPRESLGVSVTAITPCG